ncbi:hypothetical protein C8Q76DRAFT_749775 [Earliella scabrosa]|nr:hypothetical protein C8Q76DRAFT_749775 [Earliella scabrosa]
MSTKEARRSIGPPTCCLEARFWRGDAAQGPGPYPPSTSYHHILLATGNISFGMGQTYSVEKEEEEDQRIRGMVEAVKQSTIAARQSRFWSEQNKQFGKAFKKFINRTLENDVAAESAEPPESPQEKKQWTTPAWEVFPLVVFRGPNRAVVRVRNSWDDASLLRELGRGYDVVRTVWRKWFSLRAVRSLVVVRHDSHTHFHPDRLPGALRIHARRNIRIRYLLQDPKQMRDRHDFMLALTADPELGIEFVEDWQLSRIALAIVVPVFASAVLAVLYAVFRDVSDAFTIAAYMTSVYSVCLVMLGVLNYIDA